MSHKFINAGYSTTKAEPNVYKVVTEHAVARNPEVAIMIPKMKGNYNKGLVECEVNLLADSTNALRYNKPDMYSNKTQHDIDEDLQRIVKELSGILQYIINSTSWRNGEYLPFDMYEVNNRLRRLTHG